MQLGYSYYIYTILIIHFLYIVLFLVIVSLLLCRGIHFYWGTITRRTSTVACYIFYKNNHAYFSYDLEILWITLNCYIFYPFVPQLADFSTLLVTAISAANALLISSLTLQTPLICGILYKDLHHLFYQTIQIVQMTKHIYNTLQEPWYPTINSYTTHNHLCDAFKNIDFNK